MDVVIDVIMYVVTDFVIIDVMDVVKDVMDSHVVMEVMDVANLSWMLSRRL